MPEPRTIILDFETAFDTKAGYTLRKLTGPEYILDDRFTVFGMSLSREPGHAEWVDADDIPALLPTLANDVLVAHNAYFDFGILAWRYKFHPAFMLDTLGMANHVLGPARDGGGKNDLRSLAERLDLPVKKGHIDFLDGAFELDDGQRAALAAYAKTDALLERAVYEKLLPFFSNQEREAFLLHHTLLVYTQRPLFLDSTKLDETLKKLEQARKDAIKRAGVDATVLRSNPQFAAELETRLAKAKLHLPRKAPTKPRKDGVTSIPALSKGDLGFIKLSESRVPEVADLVNARIIERSAGVTTARLLTMRKYDRLGIGLPIHLNYYGAHTGRYSGGGGFNWQNLTSPDKATTEYDREVAKAVRECIYAGDGYAMVAADAAQIEARVLAWLAGEQSVLDTFDKGEDVYSKFISGVLNEEIHKPTKADGDRYQRLYLMRQVGKEAVLGLGFSMGAVKFYAGLKAGGQVKDKGLIQFVEDGGLGKEKKLAGGKVTTGMIEDIVEYYRVSNPKIVAFWGELEQAFAAAYRGGTRKVGKLKFFSPGPHVVAIKLPSSRVLYYHNVRAVSETGRFGRTRRAFLHGNGGKIYGGLLAENVTQAVARDILTEAIIGMEGAGYPVYLSIHDEVVARVLITEADAALKLLLSLLSTPPEWGKGLVLGAEGRITERMSK